MSRCGERSAWRARGAPRGGAYRPRNPRASPLWQCARRHAKELRDAGRLRRAVEEQAIERFIECGDPHHGFARIYCDACGQDPEARKKLAGYMLRAPIALEKMTYDAKTGTVIYRSKMHLGLKRNFQVMPGAEWLELLCGTSPIATSIWCATSGGTRIVRGVNGRSRLRAGSSPAAAVEPVSEYGVRAKAAWARLIRKVYEADPLECPKCKAPMRVIALIDDPAVVRRILEYLGRWAPEASERGPPAPDAEWPQNAVLPLTYHPIADIA